MSVRSIERCSEWYSIKFKQAIHKYRWLYPVIEVENDPQSINSVCKSYI
jgi:hypothetical protein